MKYQILMRARGVVQPAHQEVVEARSAVHALQQLLEDPLILTDDSDITHIIVQEVAA